MIYGRDAPYIVKARQVHIEKLQKAFASAEWRKLKSEYGQSGADTRSCRIVGGGKQVTSKNGQGPPILIDVQAQFHSLEMRALPIAIVQREGGTRGEVQTLRVFQDGTVYVLDGRHDENKVISITKMRPASLRRLQDVLKTSIIWENLQGVYDKEAPGKFQYLIIGFTYNRVVSYTEGKPTPHPLDDLFRLLNRYWSLAGRDRASPARGPRMSPLSTPTSTRSR